MSNIQPFKIFLQFSFLNIFLPFNITIFLKFTNHSIEHFESVIKSLYVIYIVIILALFPI